MICLVQHVDVEPVQVEPEPITSQQSLEIASRRDPYVRYDGALLPGDTAYRWGSAYALRTMPHSPRRRGPRGTVLGPDDADAAALLAWVARTRPWGDLAGISVERHREPTLHDHFVVGAGGDWDWWWSTVAPPRTPGEDLVVALDDTADAAAITALNEVGNPTAESEPGTGRTELWAGVRDERDGSRIIAAAALHRSRTGHGVLTGIVVDPAHRGRGLGRAVTTALTRRCIEADGVATLGMYADNDTARSLYTSLGYRVAHEFASRAVTPR